MTTFLQVPFPAPAPARPCEDCTGTGLAGAQYAIDLDGDRVMLVDAVCTGCGGCGSADHATCPPGAHITPNGELDTEPDLEDEAGDAERCYSCRSRGWIPVWGWAPQQADDAESVMLRVPCGCSEDRARVVAATAGASA